MVRVLGGFAEVWKTGGAWNTGTALLPEVLRANMRYCARVTHGAHRGAGAARRSSTTASTRATR